MVSNRASEKLSPDLIMGNVMTRGVNKNMDATRTMASLICTSLGMGIRPSNQPIPVVNAIIRRYLSDIWVSPLTNEKASGKTSVRTARGKAARNTFPKPKT
jgi:hypothetical protein